MDNYIGRLLDNRYEILESIGTGGMAVVYKARCHRLNRMVAIKILKDELSVDAEFRRRFHAESQAVAMLSHPNIVNVYDVSHSQNVDYIVMELIEGLTLKQYMQQKGALNWREALHLSTQIAKALEHAHGRGIIHRDIKPHNIMILKDGTVKVADFGIARVSSAQNTLTREALGSVHYISPEQAKGGKIDYRSDLYSLGVVMYEMLTGQPPYDGESPVAVAIKHINAQAQLPRAINPQIPLGLEQITMHAMAADMDARYEDATMMLNDLDEFRRNPNVNFAADRDEDDDESATRSAVTAQKLQEKRTSDKNSRNKKPKNKTNSVGLVAGIICIALALVLIGILLIRLLTGFDTVIKDVEVPNFVGMNSEMLDPSDYSTFILEYTQPKSSETIEAGKIMDQEPDAYRKVKEGSKIYLTVSSGPSTDTMRDLIGYMEQNARTILDNLGLGLQIEVEYEPSDVISEGAVIRTEPKAQESLSHGQTVVLIVSTGTGESLVPVPELVGLDVDTAIYMLEDLNLKYKLMHIDSNVDKGTVVYQSHKQMEQVKEGTTINLRISNGPNGGNDPENQEDEAYVDGNIIWIPMPDRDETAEIRVMVDEAEAYKFSADLKELAAEGMSISPDAEGICEIEVYIDDVLWFAMTYDFDTGVQLD